MKKIFLTLIFIITIIILILSALLVYPYYSYEKATNNQLDSQWFYLSRYDERYKKPGQRKTIEKISLKSDDLWEKFHFENISIPLPRKNPFYRVGADLEYSNDKTQFGLSIYDTDKKRISKVLFVPPYYFDRKLRSQKIFTLPLVRSVLTNINEDQLWTLLFEKEIKGWNISFSEMMTNLYLLHLRSIILPPQFESYGLINDTTALIELKGGDKDFTTELIMARARGLIYSFILVTEKDNEESKLMRYKFLREINFVPSSESLSRILYKEFKALGYQDQIDNLGMLYLLSAWSHSHNNELLKEMVFYLERGNSNQRELESIYPYLINRFGKTFSTQMVKGLNLSPDIKLKVGMDQEAYRESQKIINDEKNADNEKKEKAMQEKSNKKVNRAKRPVTTKPKRMIIE